MKDFPVKLIGLGLAAIVGVLFLWGTFSIIDPSERAIKVTLGKASQEVYGSGVQWKMPFFTHFERASAKPITQDIVIHAEDQGAVSSDNQTIGLSATVVWAYDTSRVRELATQYVNRDTLEDIVNKTIYEALKAEIGKYTIFDLAKNAGKIATAARDNAAVKAKVYPIVITQVNLTNWDWSKDFDDQIKKTMNTQQAVAQAKAEADRIEMVARQQSIQAEAQAKALVATAEGEKQAALLRADAKRAEGQGIADYNKSIAQNLEIEKTFRQLDIEKIKWTKFNGQLVPMYLPLTAQGTVVELPAMK